MMHVKRITKQGPARADIIQEIICSIAIVLNNIIEATGGSSPFLSVILGKCNTGTS